VRAPCSNEGTFSLAPRHDGLYRQQDAPYLEAPSWQLKAPRHFAVARCASSLAASPVGASSLAASPVGASSLAASSLEASPSVFTRALAHSYLNLLCNDAVDDAVEGNCWSLVHARRAAATLPHAARHQPRTFDLRPM